MIFLRNTLIICILAFACSCNSHSSNADGSNAAPKDTSAYGKWKENFDSLKLPVYFPPQEANAKKKALDAKTIDHLFSNKSFTTAFGIKDVPDLAQNSAIAKYYAEGMFTPRGAGYIGFIVHKKDQGDYYFLCTMNMKGEFIGGLCIAFQEDDPSGVLERSVSVNDDYSIEIRQTDISGVKDPSSKSAFFEVTKEGAISAIKNNPI